MRDTEKGMVMRIMLHQNSESALDTGVCKNSYGDVTETAGIECTVV